VNCRLAAVLLFRIRCSGRSHVPPHGGALILSNHQSHLDPILIGVASDRQLNFVARKTLFSFAPLRWLIYSLDAIPIDREGTGFGGIKETLKRLKQEEAVVLFPEGTRTADGEVAPLKPGFCALAKRAGVPLVPAAIDGAFDAWPRFRCLPRRAKIAVRFGPPILPHEIQRFTDGELLAEVERRIRACHSAARAQIDRGPAARLRQAALERKNDKPPLRLAAVQNSSLGPDDVEG